MHLFVDRPSTCHLLLHSSGIRAAAGNVRIRKEQPFPRVDAAAELARRASDTFVCRAAAPLEYGQLADAGVESESYIVLVSFS